MKKTYIPVFMASSLVFTGLIAGCGFGEEEENVLLDEDEEGMEEQDLTSWEEGDWSSEEDDLEFDEEDLIEDEEIDEGLDDGAQVERELYLLDDEGMVVPRSFQLPEEEGVLKQSLEHLVMDGPVTPMLPDGLQPVLPPGTEIQGVDLDEDGTATVDFSNDIEEYPEEREEVMLQAVTWTLTQYDSVDKVKFQINGHEQSTMPVAETPVGEGWTRSNGINMEDAGTVDVAASEAHTLYFAVDGEEGPSYVPVTRRIEDVNNKVEAIVEELVNGPDLTWNLASDFVPQTELTSEPELDDGVLHLQFNEALLNQEDSVSQASLDMLVLSLTELEEVEDIAIAVDGVEEVKSVAGEVIAEPVNRNDVSVSGYADM
ncbi:GerMN domain-containing protein [Salsuginibacillus kocurii]|uniref:GerMN domain-containing protein n=1 Tax=Salsuginibacillus kocurii TaxID=427078 RepID=UPI00035EA512|nr:GerMN domain-containing protein [Salsuginibacillus kocurii]